MTTNNNSPFGEPIYSYTRAQAVADGVLVDLSQFKVVRQHWKLNLCCTDTVWNLIDAAVKCHGKDYNGILHDLSMLAKIQIPHNSGPTLLFRCLIGTQSHDLKMHCGPGDTPIPCLTLMLSTED